VVIQKAIPMTGRPTNDKRQIKWFKGQICTWVIFGFQINNL
jgi:hypothetical protein